VITAEQDQPGALLPGLEREQVTSMDSSFPAGSEPPYRAAQTGKRLVLTVPVGLFFLVAEPARHP
jgi:hypothetical protein